MGFAQGTEGKSFKGGNALYPGTVISAFHFYMYFIKILVSEIS